jgi:hypothetical protein
MNKVEACNIALRALGVGTASSIDTNDPDVAEWLNVFNATVREVQRVGYPFNTDTVTLSLNGDNRIPVTGYLTIPILQQMNLTVRNGFVWDPSTADYYATAIGPTPATVEVAWDDIPELWQVAIAYKAAVDYLVQVKGPTADLGFWMSKAQNAMASAEAMYPTDYGKANGITSILGRFNS